MCIRLELPGPPMRFGMGKGIGGMDTDDDDDWLLS